MHSNRVYKTRLFSDDTIQDTSLCPPDYYHYQGYCYHYYQWVLRHYITEDYAFQHTWQLSLEQCERENATLVSIHSEEEAYFIKVYVHAAKPPQ